MPPDEVDVDDRVEDGVVDGVVHVEVLVVVLPAGLDRQEPGVAALTAPEVGRGRGGQAELEGAHICEVSHQLDLN